MANKPASQTTEPDVHQQQTEIDALRKEVQRLSVLYDAAEREVAALRSGKEEARRIAEAAEIAAAERDALKTEVAGLRLAVGEDNGTLAAFAGDLLTMVRCYEANMVPPSDVLDRVNAKRYGRPLQNGVPPKGVPA